jgi:hypothetical protein
MVELEKPTFPRERSQGPSLRLFFRTRRLRQASSPPQAARYASTAAHAATYKPLQEAGGESTEESTQGFRMKTQP